MPGSHGDRAWGMAWGPREDSQQGLGLSSQVHSAPLCLGGMTCSGEKCIPAQGIALRSQRPGFQPWPYEHRGAQFFVVYVWGCCSVHCRMFSHIPGFYQPDASSVTPVVTIKDVPRHCQGCP